MLFKKIRFSLEIFNFYIRKNLIFIFFGLILGSFVFIEKQNIYTYISKLTKPPIIIGVEGLFHSSNLPTSIANLISFGLTQISENDRITNSPLVKNLDIRNNNLEYHFTLNTDLTWQNGKRVSSEDITFSNLNISYPDRNTFVISLKAPFSPTLSLLSKPVFLKDTFIGFGDYRLISTSLKEGNYKTVKLQHISTGDYLSYKFYSNDKDLIYAFKLGEVNQISLNYIPPEFISWPNIKIDTKIDLTKYSAIFLNTEKINQKNIRQALAYATPKTNDKTQRCLGPLSPNSWAYSNIIKEYNFNQTRAKELFDIKTLPSIKLLVADRKLIDLASKIGESWRNVLGINVEISSVTSSLSNQSDFDAILAFGQIPTDPDQFSYWHSTQTKTNVTRLNNPRIDKLLEEGRNIIDDIERKRIYQDFQKYLLEESPAIFLEFPLSYTISRSK